MKIVALERNSAGTDISMECFQDFGEVIYYGNTTTKEQVKERVQEAEKLGFHTVIVPKVCEKDCSQVTGIKVVGVSSLQDVMDYLLG